MLTIHTPSSGKVNNACSYTPAPPHIFMMCTGTTLRLQHSPQHTCTQKIPKFAQTYCKWTNNWRQEFRACGKLVITWLTLLLPITKQQGVWGRQTVWYSEPHKGPSTFEIRWFLSLSQQQRLLHKLKYHLKLNCLNVNTAMTFPSFCCRQWSANSYTILPKTRCNEQNGL
jgi:hypothetical protein